MDDGDCNAVIAAAAAVATCVQSLSQEVCSGDEGLGLYGRIEVESLLKRRGRTLATWSVVLEMLEDKEDSWFKEFEDDYPKSTECGACIPKLATRRHGRRL